ncbi:MAG: hypothetical protein ABIP54_04335 [Candidatus Andersenbacteria bacterium]
MEGLAILSAIPSLEDKQRAWDLIRNQYSELILDNDQHPVVFDSHNVLCFQADSLLTVLERSSVLCLKRLAVAVIQNKMTQEHQRKVAKSIGYSLAGYFNLSYVQEWCKEVTGQGSEELEPKGSSGSSGSGKRKVEELKESIQIY